MYEYIFRNSVNMQKNKFFCLRNDESITKFPKAKFPSADNGMLSKSEMEV